jgi:hypothetical protein
LLTGPGADYFVPSVRFSACLTGSQPCFLALIPIIAPIVIYAEKSAIMALTRLQSRMIHDVSAASNAQNAAPLLLPWIVFLNVRKKTDSSKSPVLQNDTK